MTMRLFVPHDAGAIAVGADEVALALAQAAAERGVGVEIIRTGSRGLYWLEPMLEVATLQGRIAFGPVTPAPGQHAKTARGPIIDRNSVSPDCVVLSIYIPDRSMGQLY